MKPSLWSVINTRYTSPHTRLDAKNLQGFRDAWERTTTRNTDLGDSRLKAESTENLRELIKWHYSDDAKQLAGDWLRK